MYSRWVDWYDEAPASAEAANSCPLVASKANTPAVDFADAVVLFPWTGTEFSDACKCNVEVDHSQISSFVAPFHRRRFAAGPSNEDVSIGVRSWSRWQMLGTLLDIAFEVFVRLYLVSTGAWESERTAYSGT